MTNSPHAKCKTRAAASATLAKALAPEEIQQGHFVTPLYVIAEVPSYWWFGESWNLPLNEPVRIRFLPPLQGAPLRVVSVCVPFVLVKSACGAQKSIDIRTCPLARLDPAFAKRAWKALKKAAKKKPASTSVSSV